MKRLFFLLLFILLMAVPALAVDITIPQTTVQNWQRTTTAPYLYVFYSDSFTASDGIVVPAGNPQNRFSYKRITTSLLSNVVTIPSFTIKSTTDGIDYRLSRVSFAWFTTNGSFIANFDPYTDLIIPSEISSTSGCSPSGTCATFSDLKVYTNGSPSLPPDTFYNKREVDARIAATSGAPVSSPFVTTTADPTLTGEFNLGALANNSIVKLSVSGGIATPTPAVAGTDYQTPITNINQITSRSHTVLSDIGTNTHAQIDTFITSKAQASGLASLNGSSLVVQNPASATVTPTASSIPIADGSNKLADGWLSTNVSLLGQTIDLSGAEATGILAAARFPALTGDVTTSSGAISTTIANNAVTYGKMQDITVTQRIIGRNTAGSGDPEEVTISQSLDWIGSTRGSVLYRGASGWAILTPGTSGQVITSNGAGADPTYQTPSSGFSDPMTTRGDIIVRNSSNVTARLAVGASATFFRSNGTDPSWTAIGASDLPTGIDAAKIGGGSISNTEFNSLGTDGVPQFTGVGIGTAGASGALRMGGTDFDLYSTNTAKTGGNSAGNIFGHSGTIHVRSFLDLTTSDTTRIFGATFQVTSTALRDNGVPNDKVAVYASAVARGTGASQADVFAFNNLVQIDLGATAGSIIGQETNVNNNLRDVTGDSDVLNPVGIQVIGGGNFLGKWALYIGSQTSGNRWFTGIKFGSDSVAEYGMDMSEISDADALNKVIYLPNNGYVTAERTGATPHQIFGLDSNNDLVINRGSLIGQGATGVFVGIGSGKTFELRNSSGFAMFTVNDGATSVTRDWGSSSATNILATFTSYDDATRFTIRRANGDPGGTITQVLSGEAIGNLNFRGHDGTNFGVGVASITATAAENFTSTNQGTGISVATTSIGAASPVTRVIINSAGIFNYFKGADVTAAATITPTGNFFIVTGNTGITAISTTGLTAGTVLHMVFTGTPTVTDGSTLNLAGNFTPNGTGGADSLTVVFDGTNFNEIGRSLN